MAKGRRVAVSGRLEHREWTSDDVRHQVHEVAASDVEFLDAPPKDAPVPSMSMRVSVR